MMAITQKETFEDWVVTEDAMPLQIQQPTEPVEKPISPVDWIKQHILRLSSEFGVDYLKGNMKKKCNG